MRHVSFLIIASCSDFELRDLSATDAVGPAIEVTPAYLSFSSMTPTSEVVTITNVGDAALSVEQPVIDAAESGRFSVLAGDFPLSLESGASIETTVVFEAIGDTSEGQLLVHSSDPDTPTAAVGLWGVVAVPMLEIEPAEHDFGEVGLECADHKTFTLTNVGSGTLTLNEATLQSSVFSLDEPLSTSTLTPSASTTLRVRYTPTAEETSTGLLLVDSDDPRGTQYASLHGTGVAELPCEEVLPEDCEDGYWADYYNLPLSHPDVEEGAASFGAGDLPWDHDWFDAEYFHAREVEPGLSFGSNWFPVDGDLPGDPYHFAVHIVAKIEVEEDMVATFEMGSDDDSWAFIDGALEGDLAGLHALEITTFDVPLTAGIHDLELYMAERHTSESAFWFRWLSDGVSVFACPEDDAE